MDVLLTGFVRARTDEERNELLNKFLNVMNVLQVPIEKEFKDSDIQEDMRPD